MTDTTQNVTTTDPWWVWLERDDKDLWIGPYPTEDAAGHAMEHALLVEGECQESATDCRVRNDQPGPDDEQAIIDLGDPHHTGVEPTVAHVRLVAEYQLMLIDPTEQTPREWADIVLGEARTAGTIADFAVTGTYPGAWGLALVTFTVDVPLVAGTAFYPDMGFAEAKEAGTALLNGPVIHDTDVEVRWVSPVTT